MKEHSFNKLIYMIWYSGVWVVREVRSGFVSGGGELPTRNVDGCEVLAHGHYLDVVKGSESVGASSVDKVLAKEPIQLLG
jgi:hypothetical protein